MSQIAVDSLVPLSSDSAQRTFLKPTHVLPYLRKLPVTDDTIPLEHSEQLNGHFLRMCFRSLEAKLFALRMNFMPLGEHMKRTTDEITDQESTLADLDSKILSLQTQRETILSLAKTPRLTPEILQSVVASQESAVADLNSKIVILQAQRDVTINSLAINRALLAPIRRLPPEILAEIFEHCLPPKCSRDMSDSDLFEHRFRIGSPLVNQTGNDVPFLFLRICRRWRDVAQCTARLWVHVPICCNDSIPYASLCLQNSRFLPLDIRISSIQRGGECRSTRGRAVINKGQVVFSDVLKGRPKFQQMLLEKLPFAKRLEFDGSFDVLSTLFPPGRPTVMEVLEELIIESTSIPGEHGLSSLRAARLHTLALYDAIHLITSIEPTSSLRRLTLSAITEAAVGPLYDFLRLCTELEELVFHCDTDGVGSGSDTENPIYLTSLLKLEIDSDTATELLGLLRAPKLQSAILCYDPTDWQPLHAFFSVARTNLGHLALSRFQLSSPFLHDLISNLSELESLTLESCNADVGLWERLTPGGCSLPEQWICPKLKYLDICRTPLGGGFIEFVRHRGYRYLEGGGPRSSWEFIVDIKLRECNIHSAVARSLRCLQLDRGGPSILGISADDIDDGGIDVDETQSEKILPK